MKRIYLTMMILCLLAISAQAQTPAPATSPGVVIRVTYFKVKPGKLAEWIKFLRENTKPLLDEQKKQGLILDYNYYNQPTSDGPTDWDAAQVVVFKNYADALDPNPERAAKINEIALKHYGTAEARTKANDSLDDMRDVISTHLLRQVILNPVPPK